jgi:hypothetical protein
MSHRLAVCTRCGRNAPLLHNCPADERDYQPGLASLVFWLVILIALGVLVGVFIS